MGHRPPGALPLPFLPPSPEVRPSRLDLSAPCEYWIGHINAAGYGRYRNQAAHRAAFVHAYGPIPEGMEVGHACHDADLSCPGNACLHRSCFNPLHLVLQTHAENTKAGVVGRRMECKHGHPFDDANTQIVSTTGHRRCLTCIRERDRQRAARRRAIARALLRSEIGTTGSLTDRALFSQAVAKADPANGGSPGRLAAVLDAGRKLPAVARVIQA